jgi:hypothetical protein
MGIKESYVDWYKVMHDKSTHTTVSKGDIPSLPVSEDSIVKSVKDKYQKRSDVGILKYGKTLDRDDLTKEEWLNHLQEELMDATLYIEKLLKKIKSL